MSVGGNFTNCNCGPDQAACESPREPVATVGLCLADGSPIAVTVVRDCAGATTSEGWIDLTTGAWAAGAPPAGVIACGDSRSITTNGTFCDVLEDGAVAGLVLVEYQYAADGSIDSVRLVDAVTGDTYVPTGEVTTCPAGVEQPERDVLQLCDVAEDGTSTPFVRDYGRNEHGTITGHVDYALDGEPYTPTGTVSVCHPPVVEPCASTVTTLRLCDLDPNVEPDQDGKRCAVPFLRHLVHDCTGALVETRDTTPDGVTPYTVTEAVDCGGGGGVPAMVEVPWEVVGIEPDPESAEGRGLVFTLSPIDDPDTVGTVKVLTSSGYNPSSCPGTPPAYNYRNPTTYTFTPDQALRDAATYVRCDLLDFDRFEPVTGLSPRPDRLGGTAYWDGTTVRPTENDRVGEMYYDGPPETWSYRVGNTGGGNSCSSLSFAAVSLRAEGCCAGCGGSGGGDAGRTVQEVCVVANAAPATVMTWTRVIEDGGATIYYLDQDGDRYDGTLPAGHQIVTCPTEEPEPCRDAATVLLCDVPTDDGAGEATASDAGADAALYPFDSEPIRCVNPLAGGGASLWDGGNLLFPAETTASGTCDNRAGGQVLRGVAATLQAPAPSCHDGTVDVTVSVRVANDSNHAAAGNYNGSLRLHRADTGDRLAISESLLATPAGAVRTLTATATGIDAALLDGGQLIAVLDVETFDGTTMGAVKGTRWTVDQFTVSHTYGNAACETQFLRKIVTDCETGETVSVTDTTLDGEPYEATGEVGQCTAVGGGEEPDTCTRCETLTLCDVQPDASPGELEIAYETIPLADLGPAGSYGDGSPVSGQLPNGVGYSVNLGEWAAPQGHYTLYPGDGPQVWTFTEPVYVRFGLRGLNITPTECYLVPEGAVPESISPNHTWDADGRYLCEITGQSSATDESVFLLGPVTELPIVASGSSTGGRGPGLIQAGFPVEAPAPGSSTSFLRTVCRNCQGQVLTVTDTELDGGTPYTPTGEVTSCGTTGAGETPAEPCRDTSSTLLCDTTATDLVTVFDPANVPGADGWQVVSYTTVTGNPPEAALPYDAPHPPGPFMGARTDLSAGTGPAWTGYDTAPHRWVLRKTFTAAEDGTATVSSVGFRGDGGARVRVNSVDAGMYGQWNQPATSGTAQIPVTAGPNTVEIEVRDGGGNNWVQGRLDILMTRTVQFMRRTVLDCETGAALSVVDTTLDGEPYEVTGDVGQCEPVAECCEQPPPETRMDVETALLCIRDDAGDITGLVVVERVYDDQTGERVAQRLTDPTTGAEVELPAGAELVACQEPACPVAFSTECVGVVERSEASYDNTSLIGGVPGQCGGVQGPGGQFPCQPTTGGLTITSWMVNGEDVIGDGGRTFAGGPCGPGTAASPGMHANWSAALTNLDPTGATWSAKTEPACAWFVGSTGGTSTTYGPMVVEDAQGQQWTLTPAQDCAETQFTRVYSQECDGTVSVSWLDADGVKTDAPEGQQVPCGTGCGSGGGRGLDVEPVLLCDVTEDGTTTFLRHLSYGSAGQVVGALDTTLDGFTPYTPTGSVGRCAEAGVDIETLPMCVIDNATGRSIGDVVAELRYDTETGNRLSVTYVDPLTWGPVPIPGGAHFGLCPGAEPAPDVELLTLCDIAEDGTSTAFLRHLSYGSAGQVTAALDTALDGIAPYTPTGAVGICDRPEPVTVLEECRCDDSDGDGVGDTQYVELLAVYEDGTLQTVGTYAEDLSGPYTPVSPVPCDQGAAGAEEVRVVQAHRVELAPGASWSAASVPTLQSVTLTAHGGTGTITADGEESTLHEGESVSWSVTREGDAILTGPLLVAAATGTVTVAYTRTVTP
ncbi:hypothetical protein EQK42_00595 [Streptomyces albidoflavus]|uniref:hypothetical protein n=1 Tax=Streptomyces albidoflavus TaxID=1886 RepID=UPI000FF68532|nr:hypothetical protein [Streptomyces albidoflavus]RWZ77861.1 hypothetical protein EQK42_00595 [Streptomyces albidoflavus]